MEPLRREVESPGTLFAAWVPITILASAMSLSIAMAMAVLTSRPPAAPTEDNWEKVKRMRTLHGDRTTCPGSTAKPSARVMIAQERTAELAACMGDWAERTGSSARTITARFRVSREGRVSDVAIPVVDDRIVPQCVADALREIRFPSSPHDSAMQVDVKYVEGQTRVAVY